MKKLFLPALCLGLAAVLTACTARPAPAGSPDPTASPTVQATAVPTAPPAPTATPDPTPTPEPTPEPTPASPAQELTDSLALWDDGGNWMGSLRDGTMETYLTYANGGRVSVSCEREMRGLYLGWFRTPGAYTVSCGGQAFSGGQNGFLFEYIPLPEGTEEVTLTLPAGQQLGEVRAFGAGVPPADVQVWEPPCEQGTVDVLTFPTHADDDVIFLGALMTQCVDRGLTVQVCYMCNHDGDWYENTHTRSHELLRGLWEMGIRHYPVMGPFLDYSAGSLEEAKAKFDETEIVAYQVEMLRRFQPLVAAGHDREGEYGHGAHMLCAQCLERAVPLAADPAEFPDSAAQWGVWDTPKLYLHMAEENPITLDVETPLESFGGRTAFEVVNDAIQFHQSQLIYGQLPRLENSAFPRYDCRKFGLVRTTVGADTGNDIMEHTEGLRRGAGSGTDGNVL